MRVVLAERWFGAGKCLVRDAETGETHLAARLIPGELAVVEKLGERWSAQWVASEIRVASALRRAPECPHYEAGCSGCSLLHVGFDEEQRYKRSLIAEVLQRFADVVVPPESVFWLGPEGRFGHRTRTSMTIAEVNGEWVMGWRHLDGTPLRIANCRVLDSRLQDVLPTVHAALASLPAVAGANFRLHLWIEDPGPRQDRAPLQSDPNQPEIFAATDAPDLVAASLACTLRGCGVQVTPLPSIPWGQTAPFRAQLLYDWLQHHVALPNERVLDATCGTGAMTRILARAGAAVIAVDASWPAIEAARTHPAQQELNDRVQFRGGLISTVLPRLVKAGARFDTVLFNPMRETLGEATMRAAAETGAARVIYIAPAPRAAAEDIGTLRRLGYEVHEVGAADMHPGTANVLMVVVMRRAGEAARFSPAESDLSNGSGAQVPGQ